MKKDINSIMNPDADHRALNQTSQIKIKRPIGVQLAAIFGLIVLISLGTVTAISTYFMSSDVQITAENNNLSINTKAANTVSDKLSTIRSNTFQLLDLISVVSSKTQTLARQAESFFFERNTDIACIYILSENSIQTNNPTDQKIINNQFFISNELDTSLIKRFLKGSEEEIKRSCNGETIALNASPFFQFLQWHFFFHGKKMDAIRLV